MLAFSFASRFAARRAPWLQRLVQTGDLGRDARIDRGGVRRHIQGRNLSRDLNSLAYRYGDGVVTTGRSMVLRARMKAWSRELLDISVVAHGGCPVWQSNQLPVPAPVAACFGVPIPY